MTALLKVRDLELQAAGRTLVQGLSFTVQPGERWCVIGRNAAGKSTLLRALAGLATGSKAEQGSPRTHAGQAHFAPIAYGARDIRRAYMPQSAQDRFDLTVREFIALQPSMALSAAQLQTRSAALGSALDIAQLLDRPITQLSGGERQRVGLAAVAAQEAPLWLLDEPVSFQDPAHQRMVAQWLRAQSHQARGKEPQVAMVMSAHDMAWVQGVATHLIACTSEQPWVMGPIGEILSAQLLRNTFECDWTQVGGMCIAG
jgi:iron complex transport system ATP-binding protein